MTALGREPAHRSLHLGLIHLAQGVHGAPAEQFRQRRTCGNGSGTASNLVPDLGNPPFLDSSRQPHLVAASGVAHVHHKRGRAQLSRVARILKVVEQQRAEHPDSHSKLDLMPPVAAPLRVLVVAAVIERDGKILIGQRRSTDRHPLKWEFPGGKVEPEENPRDALQRELREELGIHAEIGAEIARYEFQYPKRPVILLMFYAVHRFEGEVRNLCFERIVWESRAKLPDYDFLDGDIDFVRRLAREEPW